MSKLKTRNFEYQAKKEDESKLSPTEKKIRNIIIGAVALFVVLFAVLACIESMVKNKLVIHNKSSHKITSLEIWYEDDEAIVSEVLTVTDIEAKEKLTESIEALKISDLYGEAWLTLQITFEDGGKALLQTEQYLNNFEGKISFEISDTEYEDLELHLQAGEGIFNSTAITDCDDIYYINPQNGYIE